MNKFQIERLRYLACRYLLFWLPDTWFLSLNYYFYHLGSGWHRLSIGPLMLARLRRDFLAWEASESGVAAPPTTQRPLIDQVFEEFDRTQVLPPSFDLAIMQLMLAGRPTAGPQLADKLSFRAEVERILGPEFLVPLLQESDSAQGLQPQEGAVYKASHGCGWNQFELQPSWMKRWLSSDFYWVSREWTYRGLRPRAYAEQKLQGQTHSDWPEGLSDFKVFVHRGQARLIQLNLQRQTDHRTAYYSPEWKHLNMALNFKAWPETLPHPQGLENLVQAAETLAKAYNEILFLRIDGYLLDGNVYLGEATLHPGGGNMRFLTSNH